MVGGCSWRCAGDNPWWLRLTSILLATFGALTGAVYVQFTQLEGYDFLTDLYEVQASMQLHHHGEHIRFWTLASIGASCAMFFTGVLGWVAQTSHSLVSVSAFNLVAVLLSFFFVSRMIMIFSLQPLLMAVVDRELSEWCMPASRASYAVELKCFCQDWMDYYLKDANSCGPECQSRVKILSSLGGCEYLERICDNLKFDYFGASQCQAVDLAGVLVNAPAQTSGVVTTQQCCQFACAEQQQSCRAYSFRISEKKLDWHGGTLVRGYCSVVRVFPLVHQHRPASVLPASPAQALPRLPVPPTPTLPTLPPPPTLKPPARIRRRLEEVEKMEEKTKEEEKAEEKEGARLFDCKHPLNFHNSTFKSVRTEWPNPLIITPTNGNRGMARHEEGATLCMAKGRPLFLHQVLSVSFLGGTLAGVDCLLLLLAAGSGLQLSYSLAKRRRGRKGFCFMLGLMMCPCMNRKSNRTRKLVHDRGFEDLSGSDSEDSTSILRYW